MAKSMNDRSKKLKRATSPDSRNAISSRASAAGATRSGSPDGPTTDLFGREVAPVPASVAREKEKGLRTLATSGRLGLDSSASADLQRSLESRLMQRLDTAGSTLFNLIWKARRTPLGRRYLERAASVRRTSASVCTSLPTPRSVEAGHAMGNPDRAMDARSRLEDLVFASLPTPMAGSPRTETYNEAGNNDYSRKIVEVATIPTPNATDGSKGPKKFARGNPSFPATAKLSAIATPAARDFKSNRASEAFHAKRWTETRGKALTEQAQLADSGPTATGGTDATGSIGQLNPEFSRWVMGLPIEFSNCADMAMQSFRRSRQSSSARPLKPSRPTRTG